MKGQRPIEVWVAQGTQPVGAALGLEPKDLHTKAAQAPTQATVTQALMGP